MERNKGEKEGLCLILERPLVWVLAAAAAAHVCVCVCEGLGAGDSSRLLDRCKTDTIFAKLHDRYMQPASCCSAEH
eukprot:65939-Pelagomonas_calceolata.AAC.4